MSHLFRFPLCYMFATLLLVSSTSRREWGHLAAPYIRSLETWFLVSMLLILDVNNGHNINFVILQVVFCKWGKGKNTHICLVFFAQFLLCDAFRCFDEMLGLKHSFKQL